MSQAYSVIIVGAGIFGLTAALELHQRGHAVTVFDPGPLPRPDAASTDISKMVRMDYGADTFYANLMEPALAGWDAWNQAWDEPLYHEDGFLLMTRQPMQPGEFEYESFQQLSNRGYALERMSAQKLADYYPLWQANNYVDGYYNPRAGWAESGKVVAELIIQARAAGITIYEGVSAKELLDRNGRITGILAADGKKYHGADYVILAAGAWTPTLAPHLSEVMWATGQPIFFFNPPDPDKYRPPSFLPWAADLSRTGWYGFPALKDGTLKVANHGPGRRIGPNERRQVTHKEEVRCRDFLRQTFPVLAGAALMNTRLCLYCDTWDGDFWIDHDPQRPGLFVAAGGSGHAFKFAPILGGLIVDALEGVENPTLRRFMWRTQPNRSSDAARYTD